MLIVGLVPVAVIGVSSYMTASDNIRDEAYAAMDMFSDIKDDELVDYFAEREHDGRVFATNRDVYRSFEVLDELDGGINDPEWSEHESALDDFLGTAEEEYGFDQIFMTDAEGQIIYDSIDEVVGADVAGRDYIQGALGGDTTWSELFYSDIIHENCMVVSTPVYSGGTTGSVVGTVNILFGDAVLADTVHEGLGALGDTADAYLIDENGLLLTNTLLGEYTEGAALEESIGTRAVELLSGPIREAEMDFEAAEEYLEYRGEPVLGQLEVTTLGDAPAGLIVEIDDAEAFGGVYGMRNIIIAIAVVSALIIAVAAYYLSQGISRPIREASGFADTMAGGDFSTAVPEYALNRHDEIGVLAQSFDKMQKSLKDMFSVVKESANNVHSSSESVASSSEEMNASLEEVSSTANEFAGNAQSLSENATEMDRGGKDISERAKEGSEAVEKASEQMEEISSSISSLKGDVSSLNEQAANIQTIVETIKGITDQTNMLALNAAIEAARAGEEGKGFAVVAEEVRRLAEQSSSSAEEIRGIIETIQAQSQQVADNMEESVQTVNQGREAVSSTSQILQAIIDEIHNVVGRIESVASSSEEISSGGEELSSSVEEQTATMNEIANSASQLQSLVDELNSAVDRFKF